MALLEAGLAISADTSSYPGSSAATINVDRYQRVEQVMTNDNSFGNP